MKPKTKCSTSKISSAKMSSTADKALAKSCRLRRSQPKTKEICHVYSMTLRSGLTIRKEICYFPKEPAKRYSVKAGRKPRRNFIACQPAAKRSTLIEMPMLQTHSGSPNISSIGESPACLSTYNDQSVCFDLENGCYVISVEDYEKHDEKDRVLLRYYESPFPVSGSGDGVDGKRLMVNMSPIKDTDIWLHANDKEHSVELQRGQVPPDQAFFVLHRESSEYVKFECRSQPGTFIGVVDNQLALIEEKNTFDGNIMFKLSNV